MTAMSARTVRPIPEDTASAGKALFRKGAFYQNVGDQLGELCRDRNSDPRDGLLEVEAAIPLLFLVTVFQYLESLSDSQATAAVLTGSRRPCSRTGSIAMPETGWTGRPQRLCKSGRSSHWQWVGTASIY